MALSTSTDIAEEVSTYPMHEEFEQEKSEIRFNGKVEYQDVIIEIEDEPRDQGGNRHPTSFTLPKKLLPGRSDIMAPSCLDLESLWDLGRPSRWHTSIQTIIIQQSLLVLNFGYKLFMILLSNLIAIYFQSLAVKLGSVTGMDLAQMNRAHLPRWLNIGLWILAEASIVCTDIGQVIIGTAIAIDILVLKIPLVASCALAIVDTLFILLFYRPDGSLKGLRAFELFIGVFVIAVFICFCIELSLISSTTARHVFDGFLPSRDVFLSQGQAGYRPASEIYHPSLLAAKSCLSYSIAELCVTLFFVAIFVNSAILIVPASSLSKAAQDADLFGMYQLFATSTSHSAGTMFALALFFSGISAGIVATMAGQLVMEGAMNWRIRPFYRRLAPRSIAVVPGIVIAGAEGRNGLANALNDCNVVLLVALIFLTAPLIWYTCRDRYMMVETEVETSTMTVRSVDHQPRAERGIVSAGASFNAMSLANNWPTTIGSGIIWVINLG